MIFQKEPLAILSRFRNGPFVTVQDVVLEHEDEIKKHREDGKEELDDIEARVTRVDERLTLEDGLDRCLHEREKATCEV